MWAESDTASLIPVYSLLMQQETVKKYPQTVPLAYRAVDNAIIRPEKGESVNDDVFGTIMTRMDKADGAIASYPKVQSWNRNMSLLRVGSRLYDGHTLEETEITKGKTISQAYHTLCSRNSDYFRWSNKVANRFFVIDSSHRFIQAAINGTSVDCTTNILDTFTDYEEVHMGPHEGNIDYNDQYVVFSGKKPGDTKYYIILYDISVKQRVWEKKITDNSWETVNGVWQPSQIDWVSISPSGKYIVINETDKNSYQDGLYRYNIDFADPKKLQYDYGGTLYSEGGHGDMGFDTDGNEVIVEFLSGIGVYSFNLDNPDELGKQLLKSPYGGGHVSCRNTRRKGWCYVTTHEAGYKRVFTLKLDGTNNETVQNFAQSHIHDSYPETYGAASPDGTTVIFNTNWGNANGEVDTYIVKAQ